MTTPTLEEIEAIARAMWLSQYPSLTWELDANSSAKIEFRVLALAAWHAARPGIRAQALGEAKKVADQYVFGEHIAAAIEALMEKP